jgi:hypothetical protein
LGIAGAGAGTFVVNIPAFLIASSSMVFIADFVS